MCISPQDISALDGPLAIITAGALGIVQIVRHRNPLDSILEHLPQLSKFISSWAGLVTIGAFSFVGAFYAFVHSYNNAFLQGLGFVMGLLGTFAIGKAIAQYGRR